MKLGVCIALSTVFMISFRSLSREALIVLVLAKVASGTSLKTNTICNFLTMKSVVGLNRLLLKFLLLYQVDIQESFGEKNAKFKFSWITWESKWSWRVHFQAFREPKLQYFGNHGATSRICWVYYKPLALSYSEVGTYVCGPFKNTVVG